jgi:DnaJ family protein C protein 2
MLLCTKSLSILTPSPTPTPTPNPTPQDIARRDHERKMASMDAWTDEELRLLDKACKKFPMGTPRRWDAVAAYVRTRPLDEVLLMVKEHQGAASNRLRQQEDWKGAAKRRAEVTSEADLRCMAFTDIEVNIQTPDGQGGKAAADDAAAAKPAAAAKAAAAAAAAAPPAEGENSAAGATAAKKVVSAATGEWNEEQELALVQGLKQFGKELEDRWDRIAGVVPGKTKAMCQRRFKELREAFKAKKTEA